MPVLPLVIPPRDFRIAFETPSTSLPLEKLADFASEPSSRQILCPSNEDLAKLSGRFTIQNGKTIPTSDLPGAQDETRARTVLDHLVATVINMTQPFAQLQAFVERILRAAPKTDVTTQGLKQLAEAREVIDQSAVLDKFLQPLNNGQIEVSKDSDLLSILDPDETGFRQNSRAYKLLGDTRSLIKELQKIMELSDSKLQSFATVKDRLKVQVIADQPGQYSFADNDINKTVSANQIELLNAIFNKAGLGDLIRLAA